MNAIEVLSRAPLFSGLSESARARVAESCTSVTCEPSQVVFAEGEPGFDLFIVARGVVEVRTSSGGDEERVVNYLSVGECFGEMSLITGRERSATVRVPQNATLLRLPGLAFDELLDSEACVARSLAMILASRLQTANQLHVADSTTPKHLSGDLSFFDLSEVCQTLSAGRHTGVMTLLSAAVAGEVNLFFDNGEIRHVTWLRLNGRDAVLYVLRTTLEGSFEYHSTDTYEGPSELPPIEESTMGLALEALRQRDEIASLDKDLPARDHAFVRTTDTMSWLSEQPDEFPQRRGDWRPKNGHQLELAQSVFDALAAPKTLAELVERHLDEELTVHQILLTLIRQGRIE